MPPARTRERWTWAAVALVAAGLAGALAFVHLREVERAEPAARFTVDAPDGWDIRPRLRLAGSLSRRTSDRVPGLARRPRGSPGAAMLWVRPLESLTARPLAGTEGATSDIPAWSPDGRSLAFFAGGELRRLSLADGTVQRICAMPALGTAAPTGARRAPSSSRRAAVAGRIYSVAATGGDAKLLMTLDKARGETNHHMPQFLPDGRGSCS